MREKVASSLLLVLGAITILLGSFFAALLVSEYLDISQEVPSHVTNTKVQPSQWRVFGKASYNIKDDVLSMHGPGYIYNDLECSASRCVIQFSIHIESAGPSSIGMMFLRSDGASANENVIREIGGSSNTSVTIRAEVPAAARRIRAFVYSPSREAEVVFSGATFNVKLIRSPIKDFILRPPSR
jgi:hypothetical protein